MATNVHKTMEEVLTCSICYEVYKDPVSLPCHHSYCRSCLLSLADTDKARSPNAVRCPVCRTSVNTSGKGVAGLPVNFHLAEIVEKFRSDAQLGNPPAPRCEQHGQPFSIYCVTCEAVICTGCLGDHPDHVMKDVLSACQRQKVLVVEKTDQCKTVLGELKESMAGLSSLGDDIQRSEYLHTVEIERAYKAAWEALNSWKRMSLESVRNLHTEWRRDCKTSFQDLQRHADDTDRLIHSSADLVSSTDVAILQECRQLRTRIDNLLAGIAKSMARQTALTVKLRECLRLNPAVPRHVTVHETPGEEVYPVEETAKVCRTVDETQLYSMNRPEIRFTTADEGLTIKDNGSAVVCGDVTMTGCPEARTDGRLTTGSSYWEVSVTVSPAPGRECFCDVGVSREDTFLWHSPGVSSWGLKVRYRGKDVSCLGHPGVYISPAYTAGWPRPGVMALGLYLDCPAGTLTVIDRNWNRVIGSVTNVDVSRPLVPVVRFGHVQHASASLVMTDHYTLLRVLRDVLTST